MIFDDEFTPKLGKIRSGTSRRGRKYLHQVLRATALAGGRFTGRKKSSGRGSQLWRGSGIGRVLSSRDQYAAFRQRRVIVKSRIVRLGGKGFNGAVAHMRYIQRDGVTRDGQQGQLYGADRDQVNGRDFLDQAKDNRHQFRLIVAPEDGAEYEDLKPLTRRLMAQMEQDLGTKLDWVAVDHYNTGHPHTHIILRGKDDRGKDLIIARDYLSTGMRERAAELVSVDLGPRTDLEIENRLRAETGVERLTSLDRRLLQNVGDDGLVDSTHKNAFQHSLRAGRLHKLKDMGLAEEISPGRWQLADNLEETLRRMGERGDIIKTMHRQMTEQGIARSAIDYVIDDPANPAARPLVGRVIARGLSDEINDRHYLIVDGVDGRAHYIDIGKGDATDVIPTGAVLRVTPKHPEARKVDHTIADIAAAHGGHYSIDIHLKHDPMASQTFAETHVRRLESMRRLTSAVDREVDGTWVIAADHVGRAKAYEQRLAKDAPVMVQTLSSLSLDRQLTTDGATWLDRELIADHPEPLRDSGFGKEVREAQIRRRQWLIEQGLAQEEQNRVVYRTNLLNVLQKRELSRVAGQMSQELGLAYVETKKGDDVNGIYRRPVNLASGKFAVIEKSREFTLVPWRDVLERQIGKRVSGIARGEGISWTIGRQRGLDVG